MLRKANGLSLSDPCGDLISLLSQNLKGSISFDQKKARMSSTAGSDSEIDIDDDQIVLPSSPRLSIKTIDSFATSWSFSASSPAALLPVELIFMILKYVESTADLYSCARVCRKWAHCTMPILYYRPVIPSARALTGLIRTLKHDEPMFPYATFVRRLNLSLVGALVDTEAVNSFSKCENIERLTLVGCNRIDEDLLEILISKNNEIHAIDVGGLEKLPDKSILKIAKTCPKLQGLNIAGCRRITDLSVSQIAKSCLNLRRIRLGRCPDIRGTCIEDLAANCTLLLELDIDFCDKVTDASMVSLFNSCSSLRELRLAYCPDITDKSFNSLRSGFLQSLRVIDLTGCPEITDTSVAAICTAAPKLRNLVLAKCFKITDIGALYIVQLSKTLHLLHLGHCEQLTDKSVVAIAQSCNRLRYVDLACCARITDRSVVELARLPKLKRVGLVKCVRITDVSIYELAINRTRNLERAHLSYCTNLSLDAVFTLMYACRSLTHLSVTGIQPFLREDIKQFRRPPPKEFTPSQEAHFCVFSGSGLARCREYLLSLPRESAMNPPITSDETMLVFQHQFEQFPPAQRENVSFEDSLLYSSPYGNGTIAPEQHFSGDRRR